jgi:hypothetical protein
MELFDWRRKEISQPPTAEPAKKHFHPAPTRVVFETRDVPPSRTLFGQIPKWPTGEDCKSSGFAFTGSNPVLPILFDHQRIVGGGDAAFTGPDYIFVAQYFPEAGWPWVGVIFGSGLPFERIID